jgi:hypothetical protein
MAPDQQFILFSHRLASFDLQASGRWYGARGESRDGAEASPSPSSNVRM